MKRNNKKDMIIKSLAKVFRELDRGDTIKAGDALELAGLTNYEYVHGSRNLAYWVKRGEFKGMESIGNGYYKKTYNYPKAEAVYSKIRKDREKPQILEPHSEPRIQARPHPSHQKTWYLFGFIPIWRVVSR